VHQAATGSDAVNLSASHSNSNSNSNNSTHSNASMNSNASAAAAAAAAAASSESVRRHLLHAVHAAPFLIARLRDLNAHAAADSETTSGGVTMGAGAGGATVTVNEKEVFARRFAIPVCPLLSVEKSSSMIF
jgi:hypothetical protein